MFTEIYMILKSILGFLSKCSISKVLKTVLIEKWNILWCSNRTLWILSTNSIRFMVILSIKMLLIFILQVSSLSFKWAVNILIKKYDQRNKCNNFHAEKYLFDCVVCLFLNVSFYLRKEIKFSFFFFFKKKKKWFGIWMLDSSSLWNDNLHSMYR